MSDERRKDPDLATISAQIERLAVKFEEHLKQEDDLRPKIEEMLEFFSQGKGIAKALRMLIYVAAPAFAAFAWIKDHFKW